MRRRPSPSTTQPPHSVWLVSSSRALAPVLHRHERDAQIALARLLPPVVLVDARDAEVREPRLQPQRHEEARAALRHRGEARHRSRVEVVVVVVRDQHDVDRGRSAMSIGSGTTRFGPAKRTGDARSEKIGSNRMFLPARRTSIVAWPIHVTDGLASGDAQRRRIGLHRRQVPAARRRLRQAVAQPLPLPGPEALPAGVRVVVAEAVGSVRRGLRERTGPDGEGKHRHRCGSACSRPPGTPPAIVVQAQRRDREVARPRPEAREELAGGRRQRRRRDARRTSRRHIAGRDREVGEGREGVGRDRSTECTRGAVTTATPPTRAPPTPRGRPRRRSGASAHRARGPRSAPARRGCRRKSTIPASRAATRPRPARRSPASVQ